MAGVFGGVAESPKRTEDGEEASMLVLLVAALVPTVVMGAALALERLERCVLSHVPLDRAHVDRRGNDVGG